MKKLLSLLGTVTLVATASSTVVACGDTKPKVVSEYDTVLKEFKKEVNQIVNEHVNDASKNLFLVEGKDNQNMLFFKKDVFTNYMGNSSSKNPDETVIKDLNKDFNDLLNVDILKYKIDSLKNNERYAIILEDVDNVFKGIELTSNNQIQLKSSNSVISGKDSWFGSAELKFSVIVNFKNNDRKIEEFRVTQLSSIISMTDNEQIGGDIQLMYSEFEKEFVLSEFSRIYAADLGLLTNGQYLENKDKIILDYLNSEMFTTNFVNFIDSTWNVSIRTSEFGTFENLNNVATYRENKITNIDSNGNTNEEKFETLYNYFKVLTQENADISKIIDDTTKEAEKYISSKFSNNLNNISDQLHLDETLQNELNASLKMQSINTIKLSYKVDQNTFIDIPNLTLNLFFLRDQTISSRKEMHDDIAKNIELASSVFREIYDIAPITNEDTYLFDFNKESKVKEEWMDESLGDNESGSISSSDFINYSNLTKTSLMRDYRSKLIKESKQNDFNFNLYWNGGLSKTNLSISKEDSIFRLPIPWTSHLFSIRVILEFDYFKLTFLEYIAEMENRIIFGKTNEPIIE